jgi:general secretion pathway protein J
VTPQESGQSGFTLFEILVGLLVSVLIMAGLTVAMRSMNVGWESTVDALGRQDLFANGFHIIAGDISRIERMPDKIENADRFLFSGSRSEAVFLLSERPASNQEGLYWIRMFVRSGDDGTELIRMRAPFEDKLQDLAGIAWRDEVVLLRGRFMIGFSYRAPRGGFPEWTTSWEIRNRLPEQMRVEILDPATGQPLMPPLVQTLNNTAETECINLKSPGCTVSTKGELVPRKSDSDDNDDNGDNENNGDN